MGGRKITTNLRHYGTGARLKATRHGDSMPLDLIEDDGDGPSVRVWDITQQRERRCYEVPNDGLMSTLSDTERQLIEGHVPARRT
jgi:hypothetical protein